MDKYYAQRVFAFIVSALGLLGGCSTSVGEKKDPVGLYDEKNRLDGTLKSLFETDNSHNFREKSSDFLVLNPKLSSRYRILSYFGESAIYKIKNDEDSYQGLYAKAGSVQKEIANQVGRLSGLRVELISYAQQYRNRNDFLFALPIIGTAVGAGVSILNNVPTSALGSWAVAGAGLSYTEKYFNFPDRIVVADKTLRAYECIGAAAVPLLSVELIGLVTAKRDLDWAMEDALSVLNLEGMSGQTRAALTEQLALARVTLKGLNTEWDVYASLPASIANQLDALDTFMQSKRTRGEVSYDTAFTAIESARLKTIAAANAKAGGSSGGSVEGDQPKPPPTGVTEKPLVKAENIASFLDALGESNLSPKEMAKIVKAAFFGRAAEKKDVESIAQLAMENLLLRSQQGRLAIPTPSISAGQESLIKCTAFLLTE